MRFEHAEHPGRSVRLAYCMNLHPAEDLVGLRAGLAEITRPLVERLRPPGGFGIGAWIPAALARELASPQGEAELERLARELADGGLDAFTFNAFPAGGFHRPGLKAGVFHPTWKEPARVAFTTAVARVATRLAGAPASERHLSISTHAGGTAADVATAADRAAVAAGLARAVAELARLEAGTGWRVVLSLEAEPRSAAGDTAQLESLRAAVRRDGAEVLARELAVVPERAAELFDRHLGTCLDTCHAAVELEPPDAAWRHSTTAGPLGKLQVTSALRLVQPGRHPAGVARLLALDEPIFLHQVTGRGPDGPVRAGDLDEVRPDDPAWARCDEWRCHFHVPVDLESLGDGLVTTRDEADAILDLALSSPERWGTEELHLEIETYTWPHLPEAARGSGGLVDGLEREYRHVLARLARSGWEPAGPG